MAEPDVPIDVDQQSGVWSTDGLPMLYLPRHFFINNHLMIDAALGRETYARLLYEAGYRSARTWCQHEADVAELTGMDVFHHYMKRLSQRGWGRFDGSGIDPVTGCGEVTVHSSCFVLDGTLDRHGPLCFMFAGWFPGALDWIAENQGQSFRVTSDEVRCAGEGHEHCVFEIAARTSSQLGSSPAGGEIVS